MKLDYFFMLLLLAFGLTSCAYINGLNEPNTSEAQAGTTIQVPAAKHANPNNITAPINTNASKMIAPATF